MRFRTDGEVFPFAYHLRGADIYLKAARSDEEGRFFNCMVAMLLSAFAVEAYLNHVGLLICPGWDLVERRLGPKEKLQLLTRHLGKAPDWGKRPFQTLDHILGFRNATVHARVSTGIAEGECDMQDSWPRHQMPETAWTKLVTVGNAGRFAVDARGMTDWLYTACGSPKPSPGTLATWSGSQSLVADSVECDGRLQTRTQPTDGQQGGTPTKRSPGQKREP